MDREFNTLTPAQLEMHGLYMKGDELHYLADDEDKFMSPIGEHGLIMTYYSFSSSVLTSTVSSDTIRFDVDMKRHRLVGTDIVQFWPKLSVKDNMLGQVEICWTHNPGTNHFTSIEWCIGSNTLVSSLDNPGIDVVNEYLVPKNKERCEANKGNIPILEQWTTSLPEWTTQITVPWSWTRCGPAASLPLYYFNETDCVNFKVHLRSKIEDLLRMRILVNPEKGEDGVWRGTGWKIIKPNLNFIDGVPNSKKLDSATMVGYYIDLLDYERDRYQRAPECGNGKNMINGKLSWTFEQIVALDWENDSVYNNNVKLPTGFDYPAKTIFAMAENLKAKELNLYSNYTSNSEDLYQGSDTIREIILSNEQSSRKQSYNLPTIRSMEALIFPSVPRVAGYLAIPRSVGPHRIDDISGTSLKNNHIYLTACLQNMNPFGDDEHPRFKARFRIQVIRKIIFSYDISKRNYTYKLD
jgi:hypothetical protein